MIQPLLEQSNKIAKKNPWIITGILMFCWVAREQMREGRMMREFCDWEWMNPHKWIKGALYIVEEGETNKGNKYFNESIIIQFSLF